LIISAENRFPVLISKRLHGELEGKYRYEMGVFRIVYEVNVKDKTVEIKSIGGRGDVYER
jgi:mRNA-degrading endonuclease RelE of RelBE toxin-antitoxin system